MIKPNGNYVLIDLKQKPAQASKIWIETRPDLKSSGLVLDVAEGVDKKFIGKIVYWERGRSYNRIIENSNLEQFLLIDYNDIIAIEDAE